VQNDATFGQTPRLDFLLIVEDIQSITIRDQRKDVGAVVRDAGSGGRQRR
jgi:hypothetical protein